MDSNDNKLKHLDYIQQDIARMASNSFLLKAWTVTLISALFALAAKDADKNYVLVAFFPTGIFWFLDGYYLSQERLFRKLYDNVRLLDPIAVDFSMSTANVKDDKVTIVNAMFSLTLASFYVSLIILLGVITVVKL